MIDAAAPTFRRPRNRSSILRGQCFGAPDALPTVARSEPLTPMPTVKTALTRLVLHPLAAAAARARAFAHDRQAATAVEFALIVTPFLALIFAIIETALCFFAGQALETAVMDASRAIRTGQAQQSNYSANDFQASICSQLTYMFNCSSNLYVSVQTFANFSSIALTTPTDAHGNLATTGFPYGAGHGSDIVVVRAYYEWPVFINTLGNNLANEPDGKHLLIATAAFQNEPFPW
jgi:Flp pilus assembly protein TadG